WAGPRPRPSVGSPERDQPQVGGLVGDVGVAVADGRPGPYPAYRDQRSREGGGGPQPRRRVWVDPAQPGSHPTHGVVAARVGQGGGRGREMALRRPEPTAA